MIQLKRHEFTCPFCNNPKVTFVTENKLREIRAREKTIQEILNPSIFDASYREIFVSKICSACQIGVFGGNPEDKPFDVDEDAKTDELEARISEMYENDRE